MVIKSKSHPNLKFLNSSLCTANNHGRGGQARNKHNHHHDDDDDDTASFSSSSSSSDMSTHDVHAPKTSRNPTKQQKQKQQEHDRHAVGGLLWQLILSQELVMPTTTGDHKVDWKKLQDKHPLLSQVSLKDLQSYYTALTSIVILDPILDERAESLLADNGYYLVDDVSPGLLQTLYDQRPSQFTAYVADFNDNLAYQYQPQRGFFPSYNSAEGSATPNNNNEEKWNEEWQILQTTLQQALYQTCPSQLQQRTFSCSTSNNTNDNHHEEMEVQASFLQTHYKTMPQPAHVDYPWLVLQALAQYLWLAFFPLTSEGCFLQVWPQSGQGEGVVVFLPLGKLLVVPSDTIHGGGFRSRPRRRLTSRKEVEEGGNLRYHLYLATHGSSLPPFAQNVYTTKDDKRYEMSDVSCLMAPHLGGGENDNNSALLMDLLFES